MDELFPETKKRSKDWIKDANPASDPVFWIAEVQLLSSLSAESLIRSIPLKKGLNIVWSEGGRPGGDEKERGRGHGAGKTAFCRIIRYILGEHHYGNRFIRDRLAANKALKRAYVAAEIWLNGRQWSVIRSLYVGGKQFAVAGSDISSAISAPSSKQITHRKFVELLQEAVLSRFPVSNFGADQDNPILWDHVIQPLSRDQEAHLSSLHNWRETASAAEPAGMSDADRAFLMRCILGIADTKEGEKLKLRSEFQNGNKQAQFTIDTYRQVARDAIDDIKVSFPDLNLPATPDDSLFANKLASRAEKSGDEKVGEILKSIDALGLDDLKRRINQHSLIIERIKGRIEERQEQIESLKSKLDAFGQIENPTPKDNEAIRKHLLEKLRQGNRFCAVPIEKATECRIYWQCGIQDQLKMATSEEFALETVPLYKQQISLLETELAPHLDEIANNNRAIDQLKQELQERQAREATFKDQINQIRRAFSAQERNGHILLSALRHIETAKNEFSTNNLSIKDIELEIQSIREDSRDRQKDLSNIFNAVLQSIAGRHFSGELVFTNIENNAKLKRFNETESEGYKALKALAYDLSALLAMLHGIGHHPGFLMHDSPRESDLEASIYHPFIDFTAMLASLYPGTFQHIITTTENPPDHLQGSPPVCLKLSSQQEPDFLFRKVL